MLELTFAVHDGERRLRSSVSIARRSRARIATTTPPCATPRRDSLGGGHRTSPAARSLAHIWRRSGSIAMLWGGMRCGQSHRYVGTGDSAARLVMTRSRVQFSPAAPSGLPLCPSLSRVPLFRSSSPRGSALARVWRASNWARAIRLVYLELELKALHVNLTWRVLGFDVRPTPTGASGACSRSTHVRTPMMGDRGSQNWRGPRAQPEVCIATARIGHAAEPTRPCSVYAVALVRQHQMLETNVPILMRVVVCVLAGTILASAAAR